MQLNMCLLRVCAACRLLCHLVLLQQNFPRHKQTHTWSKNMMACCLALLSPPLLPPPQILNTPPTHTHTHCTRML